MEYPLNQSTWRRGWNDTKAIWASWHFYVLDAVVAVVIGGLFEWYWGLGVVLFGMLCVWIGATASAPIKQRNEARALLMKRPQPRPLQNRDNIIRSLFDIERMALELIGYKRELAESFEHSPDDTNRQKQVFQKIQRCEAEYSTAIKSVEREIRVAGEDYAPAINSLLMVMKLGVAFWNSTTNSGQDYLDAYKNILERHAKEIRNKLDELNQQALYRAKIG